MDKEITQDKRGRLNETQGGKHVNKRRRREEDKDITETHEVRGRLKHRGHCTINNIVGRQT